MIIFYHNVLRYVTLFWLKAKVITTVSLKKIILKSFFKNINGYAFCCYDGGNK